MIPPFALLKRVRVAQREALEAVEKERRNNRWDHTSKDAFYRAVLHCNGRLLSTAKDASPMRGLIENRVVEYIVAKRQWMVWTGRLLHPVKTSSLHIMN